MINASSRTGITRQGFRGALDLRNKSNVSGAAPICVYDLAETLGVEVRFVRETSFEGMYSRASRTILVPALRPPGRKAFACAHELGHWFFGHASSLYELEAFEGCLERSYEEILANAFASYLLMPPKAVRKAFQSRGWPLRGGTPLQVYTVAMQLGVGYSTLTNHLFRSLGMISAEQAARLLKVHPKDLRRKLLGCTDAPHLVIVDPAWDSVPVDLEVGDYAVVPKGSHIEGRAVAVSHESFFGLAVIALEPGSAHLVSEDRDWVTIVRISKRSFVGRSIYRYLEDPDVNEIA